ncbi:MAG: tetratricopeptide repeat protein, partial [bacterium]|nr:tetratricopeptide repeat protein [bacterium]
MIKKIKHVFLVGWLIVLSGQQLSGQQTGDEQKQQEQLFRLARSFEQTSQFSRALDIYQKLWEREPANINYYRGVKNNLLNIERFEQAESVVRQMLKINQSEIIEADLAEVFYKKGETQIALEVLENILKRSPKKVSAYQIVASVLSRFGFLDQAIETYQQGRDELNNQKLFLIEMANNYRSQMNYQQAVALYLEYMEYYPGQYHFVERNVTSFAIHPEIAGEIEAMLLNKIQSNQDNLDFRNLLAAFYIRGSNYRAALEEYSIIDQYIMSRSKVEKQKLGGELFRFAQNAFNDGAYEYAIKAYQLVVSRYPESNYAPNSKLGIARSYQAIGDYSQALEIFAEVNNNYPNTIYAKESEFRTAEVQMEHFSNFDAAIKSFRKVISLAPFNEQNYEAWIKIGDCHVLRGELKAGESRYQKIIDQKYIRHDLRMKALFKMGRLRFWQGDFNKADHYFIQIQTDPVNIINENEGMFVNDAIEYRIRISENKRDSVGLAQFASAEFLAEQGKVDQARALLEKISDSSGSGALVDDALLKIGELDLKHGKYQDAVSAFKQLVQNFPESFYADFAQKRIAEIYQEGFQDTTSAIK